MHKNVKQYLHSAFNIDYKKIITFDMLPSSDPIIFNRINLSNKEIPKTE